MSRRVVNGVVLAAGAVAIALSLVMPRAEARSASRQEDDAGNRDLYEACGPAVVQLILGGRPHGHGFFVTDQGHLFISYHQVSRAGRLIVEDAEGKQSTATVLHGDPVRDVALLKIDEATPHYLSISAEDLPCLPGMEVFLIRYKDERPERVLSGRVIDTETSSFGRVIDSTVPSRPGDSGSPLVDDAGRLLGLNRGGSEGQERPRTHSIHLSTLRQILKAYRDAPGFELTIIQNERALPVLLRLWDATDEEHGTDPQENGVTTLMRAAAHGYPAIVIRLLRKGATVDAQDSLGNTALFYALKRRHAGPVRPLLSHGASANATNNEGLTPLMLAVSMQMPLAIRALIEAGATGYSVLQAAIFYGDDQAILTLIEAGADVNYSGPRGTTALMAAATRSRVAVSECGHIHEYGILHLLIDAGAVLDAKTSTGGYTALMYAASYGSPANVETLIKAGADVTGTTDEGYTALDLARHRRDDAGPLIVELLAACEKAGDSWESLFPAAGAPKLIGRG